MLGLEHTAWYHGLHDHLSLTAFSDHPHQDAQSSGSYMLGHMCLSGDGKGFRPIRHLHIMRFCTLLACILLGHQQHCMVLQPNSPPKQVGQASWQQLPGCPICHDPPTDNSCGWLSLMLGVCPESDSSEATRDPQPDSPSQACGSSHPSSSARRRACDRDLAQQGAHRQDPIQWRQNHKHT